MKTVLEYLEYSAAVRPHAVAVEDAWGTATFQELEVGCRKVGSALTERIALREPVAIFLEKGRQALWAFWGTVYAGGFRSPVSVVAGGDAGEVNAVSFFHRCGTHRTLP